MYWGEPKPISIVKAADETVVMIKDIHEGSGGMVTKENDTHEDTTSSVVKARNETVVIDNNVCKNDGGTNL